MIGRVRIDQASALFWGAALAGPERPNIVIPYGLTWEGGAAKRAPLRAGYHGAADTRRQGACEWTRWALDPGVEAWAIAPGRLGVVVVDVDDPGLVGDLLDLYGETPVWVETPSHGMHLYYQAPLGLSVPSRTGIRGPHSYDVKATGATVHAPGSRHHRCPGHYLARAPGLGDDGAVLRVERGEAVPLLAARSLWPLLPEFPAFVLEEEWERWHPPHEFAGGEKHVLAGTHAEREMGARYLAAAGPAVQGNGGHDHTRGLILKLGDLGFPEAVGRELLVAWNQTCEPPWSEYDLETKIVHYYRRRNLPIGWRAREWGLVEADDLEDDPDADMSTDELVALMRAEVSRA